MSEPACWATLPAELQHEILQVVEDDPEATSATLINYILVCKTWQNWFEDCNYQHLVINSSRLSDLDRLVGQNPRRRASVKKISVRIHLKPQPRAGHESESDYQKRLSKRGTTLTAVLLGLLECLKDWTRPPHRPGVALEILTYSHREHYGQADTDTHTPSPEIRLNLLRPLPKVPVITTLFLRGKYHHCLKYPTLAKLLKHSFTNLRRLHIEGSHHGHLEDRVGMDEGHDFTEVVEACPSTLQSWTFIDPVPYMRRPRRINGEKMPLGTISANLEHLVFSRAMDANDFFLSSLCKERGPAEVGLSASHISWSRLKILSLTGLDLNNRDRDKKRTKDVLLMAANFLRGVPTIQLFELWSTREANGAVFRYITTTTVKDGRVSSRRTTAPSTRKATVQWCLATPSGGHQRAKEIWQGEVETAWTIVAYSHNRTLEVSCEGLGFGTVDAGRPSNPFLYYEEHIIDWDGREEYKLVQKGDSGYVETI